MQNEYKLINAFADNYETLSKFAIMIVKNKDAALDIMQNVALIIVKKGYQIEEIRKPTAFLITCVRRAALNYLRNESRACPTDPAILEETHRDKYSPVATDYIEWIMYLEKCLSSYSPQLQSAFIKHYIDGFPLDMIANELGMTSNALAQQLKRMRNKVANSSKGYRAILIFLSYM